ncbi:hypothetical protein [Winogradskyella alexanderae]|uniref:DUF4179 domain-containing protein n=1 Tax=Winogradskyella alexanderae TaxID=2877123 RepID=A0ABS7XS16_9FLAO|nr:hypothetical protein [Winogradskyella alexanderae]MCA0131636.1 hypothetical protein [Winogradskyella alexanderae]
MDNKNIDKLFEDLQGRFDINKPKLGHQLRFLDKLNESKNVSAESGSVWRLNWKPLMAVAASIIVCLGIFFSIPNDPELLDLASISPEMSNTQDFFTTTIENELKKLNDERSPLTQQIIDDALKQLQLLENEYTNLKIDLTESNEDQRVIYAMISNFQSRIEILNNVLEQIENVKQFKSNTDENTNTI